MEELKTRIHNAFDNMSAEVVKKEPDWAKVKRIVEDGVRAYSNLRREEAEQRRQAAYQRLKYPRPDYIPATDQKETEKQILGETEQVTSKFKNDRAELLKIIKESGRTANRGTKKRRDWLDKVRKFGVG